jgi:protein-glucosylgalactosylhydroxylysine glucosidase
MFPVLTVLFPELARVAATYRMDRVGASGTNAALSSYNGSMWAWESAFTGLWTAPWRGADLSENHISADIPLALRKFYYATGDSSFLAEAWPLLSSTCSFWECRFSRVDAQGGPEPGAAQACGAKDGSGNWTVLQVITPDESSGITNHSAYTNAAGAETLKWCLEAAAALQQPTPPLWATIAAAPYLPLSSSLYAGGTVHMPYSSYKGGQINQADVALLQYPLGLQLESGLAQRDLDYFASRTDFAGMFTGDSSYSCAYLALGNRSAADAQLSLAFGHMSRHFSVFTETELSDGGHTQHFITGAGGYIQGLVFGYSGLRIERLGVLSFASQQPILPPLGVSHVKLRGLHLLGTALDFSWDAQQLCVALQQGPGGGSQPLELRVRATGQVLPLALTEACVPLGAVDVAGVGY